MKDLDLDYFFKMLEKFGGYPNDKMEYLLDFFEWNKKIFFDLVEEKYGVENWIIKNIERMNNMNGGKGIKIGLSSWMNGTFVFIQINGIALIDGDRGEIIFKSYKITDSMFNTPHGNMPYEECLIMIDEEDPYQVSDFISEVNSAIDRGLSEKLGFYVSSEDGIEE